MLFTLTLLIKIRKNINSVPLLNQKPIITDFSSTIISEISTTVPSTTVSGRTITTSLNVSNKTEALVPSSTVYSEDKTQTTLDSTSSKLHKN
jgi:translation initiation factor 6 (eIF-6)